MADQKTGLLDLEKELTCSICTDILYQPLSLIDCLHTFCGSCLKIWFGWQAVQKSPSSPNPFTCPSCRATVLRTKHDAKVQTLVDMFLQVNPNQAKKQEELEDIGKRYAPGEDVLPTTVSRELEDDEDRRMVEEVRAISLQDVGARHIRSYERGTRHETRNREESRREHRTIVERTAELESQARQIEHQPSLRSLISNSDLHSADMQEEILRQITDEGLLDGIDLNNMNVAQEDELSERIAEAYRRRHRLRARVAETPENLQAQETSRSSDHRSRRTQSRFTSATEHAIAGTTSPHSSSAQRSPRNASPTTSSHPPVSRPHLLEARQTGTSHPRRRTASEGRRQTAPMPGGNDVRYEAARSATDLSNRPRSSETREPRLAIRDPRAETMTRDSRPADLPATRRTTEPPPRPRRLSENAQRQNVLPLVTSSQSASSQVGTSQQVVQRAIGVSQVDSPIAIASGSPRLQSENTHNQSPPAGSSSERQLARSGYSSLPSPRSRFTIYSEPSISCERCGRTGIQYELYENCSVCNDGNYNLCHRCYRLGLGCLVWNGFGTLAWSRFQSQAGIDPQLPHTLTGRKYARPPPESIQSSPPSSLLTTTSNPTTRLETGVFCSNCCSSASDCFWLCSICNEGEWGFCDSCVNRGHHCTHPLLPIASVTSAPLASGRTFASRKAFAYPTCNLGPSGQYRALSLTTTCIHCSEVIPPQELRYQCPSCDIAEKNICAPCYNRLAAAGTVEPTWRRCQLGHRIVIIRFIETATGWRRVVVRDRAGGCALRDDGGSSTNAGIEWSWPEGDERHTHTSPKALSPTIPSASTANVSGNTMDASKSPHAAPIPPDGGVGMRVLARYGYWPVAGADNDDLKFPRGAEIREVENINDEWFWGCYRGFQGTFPASYVHVLEE